MNINNPVKVKCSVHLRLNPFQTPFHLHLNTLNFVEIGKGGSFVFMKVNLKRFQQVESETLD